MPRLAGQIDQAKGQAILDAAIEVLAERGLGASMEEIARRAGVSKQTIYNHYGSKAELIRALVDRRVADITAPLEMPGADELMQRALFLGTYPGLTPAMLAYEIAVIHEFVRAR